ncbi:MAG: heavy-metal-associated domain-containing protein [Acidobacteria bacterium]|nr:heavy-metal-associated domain-containing protein [Acidobacteriota bacterium]
MRMGIGEEDTLMRYWIIVAVILAFTMTGHSIAQTKEGQQAVCKLKVTGMTCGGCEGAVKLAAKRVDGVRSVTVSYKMGTADVTYDAAKTSPEAIAKAVTANSGFKAEVAKK